MSQEAPTVPQEGPQKNAIVQSVNRFRDMVGNMLKEVRSEFMFHEFECSDKSTWSTIRFLKPVHVTKKANYARSRLGYIFWGRYTLLPAQSIIYARSYWKQELLSCGCFLLVRSSAQRLIQDFVLRQGGCIGTQHCECVNRLCMNFEILGFTKCDLKLPNLERLSSRPSVEDFKLSLTCSTCAAKALGRIGRQKCLLQACKFCWGIVPFFNICIRLDIQKLHNTHLPSQFFNSAHLHLTW